MDQSNSRPTQGASGPVGDPSASRVVQGRHRVQVALLESGYWRAHLQADSRQRVINKIVETLERCIPMTGREGQQELKKMAERFEEKIYTAATSLFLPFALWYVARHFGTSFDLQSDYVRKISLKMLIMERTPLDPDIGCADLSCDDVSCVEISTNWNCLKDGFTVETLERCVPMTGRKGQQELKKMTERFEEKIYTAATSLFLPFALWYVARHFGTSFDLQSDYVRKISLKMLIMERTPLDPVLQWPGQRVAIPWKKFAWSCNACVPFGTLQRLSEISRRKVRMTSSHHPLCAVGDTSATMARTKGRDPVRILPCAAKFRTEPFPRYNKLHAIFVEDTSKGLQANGLGVKVEDVVPENQIIPCLEGKKVHDNGNASSFNRVKEIVSNKRKRTDGNDLNGDCVKSKVANQGINAVNDMMGKIATEMKDLPSLTLDERLVAMSVIGGSEPLTVMFD
ncbi:hypothetical protein CTI12_AA387540 [Artemisia annua]|uniref:Mediator complex subunit 15 KIX domain-containing protein n=1 Tax=Artemisia annua TaxID=35608 RepID=A0A2U1MF62_ARTAN|nr:hypothetical protein CTI12_AA387540 [Artemisia annua]